MAQKADSGIIVLLLINYHILLRNYRQINFHDCRFPIVDSRLTTALPTISFILLKLFPRYLQGAMFYQPGQKYFSPYRDQS